MFLIHLFHSSLLVPAVCLEIGQMLRTASCIHLPLLPGHAYIEVVKGIVVPIAPQLVTFTSPLKAAF